MNPYLPPEPIYDRKSRWSSLARCFDWRAIRARLQNKPAFANGHPIIVNGIAFFIDPYDSKTLYAGSPSDDRSDERLKFIVKEVLISLPIFLDGYADAKPQVKNRRLVVRITNDYRGIFSDYFRAVEILPAPLISNSLYGE